MANNIKDIDKNYVKIKEILSNRYEEVGGYDFYRYLFPNNQNEGEYSDKYEKPNAIYLYKDGKDEGTERTLRRRIMLNEPPRLYRRVIYLSQAAMPDKVKLS